MLSKSATYSAPVVSGPHSHFCPDTVYQSATDASTGMAPTDCAPSTRRGRPVTRLMSASGRTWPLSHNTLESAPSRYDGVTSALIDTRAWLPGSHYTSVIYMVAPDPF